MKILTPNAVDPNFWIPSAYVVSICSTPNSAWSSLVGAFEGNLKYLIISIFRFFYMWIWLWNWGFSILHYKKENIKERDKLLLKSYF